MSTQAKLLKDVPVIDIDAYPILGKIPGKPWRWSKNVTASEIGGGNLLPYIAERRCAA